MAWLNHRARALDPKFGASEPFERAGEDSCDVFDMMGRVIRKAKFLMSYGQNSCKRCDAAYLFISERDKNENLENKRNLSLEMRVVRKFCKFFSFAYAKNGSRNTVVIFSATI